MVKVEYICGCGNKVSAGTLKHGYGSPHPNKGYIPIDKNLKAICGGCGKIMLLEITKETTETKTETIRKEN